MYVQRDIGIVASRGWAEQRLMLGRERFVADLLSVVLKRAGVANHGEIVQELVRFRIDAAV